MAFELLMVCEPPAFGFTGTQTKCTHFQFRLWRRTFYCSGSLFYLALFFLDIWLTGAAQFGLVVCVCARFPSCSSLSPQSEGSVAGSMWKGLRCWHQADLCLLLVIRLPSQLCVHQKNRDFSCLVFCCIPGACIVPGT